MKILKIMQESVSEMIYVMKRLLASINSIQGRTDRSCNSDEDRDYEKASKNKTILNQRGNHSFIVPQKQNRDTKSEKEYRNKEELDEIT